jgi:hypothetical protein
LIELKLDKVVENWKPDYDSQKWPESELSKPYVDHILTYHIRKLTMLHPALTYGNGKLGVYEWHEETSHIVMVAGSGKCLTERVENHRGSHGAHKCCKEGDEADLGALEW